MNAWVLIVDDDVDNRELLAELLASVGYEGVTCGSADEAEQVLDARGRPSVVIADVKLPDRQGPRFVADMRSRQGFAQIPVVFVTGTSPDRMAKLEDPVLVKPVDLDQLVTFVARHCDQSPGLTPQSPT